MRGWIPSGREMLHASWQEPSPQDYCIKGACPPSVLENSSCSCIWWGPFFCLCTRCTHRTRFSLLVVLGGWPSSFCIPARLKYKIGDKLLSPIDLETLQNHRCRHPENLTLESSMLMLQAPWGLSSSKAGVFSNTVFELDVSVISVRTGEESG